MQKSAIITEYAKIFINVASLLLGLSLTFVEKIAGQNQLSLFIMTVAWIAWVGSIWFGALAIRRLVNVETPEDDDAGTDVEDTVYSSSITTPLFYQVSLCIAGFALVAFVAIGTAISQKEIDSPAALDAKIENGP